MIKVKVTYKDGRVIIFIVPEDGLLSDFQCLAELHGGRIKKLEFV